MMEKTLAHFETVSAEKESAATKVEEAQAKLQEAQRKVEDRSNNNQHIVVRTAMHADTSKLTFATAGQH